jgi:hypothetical protein
MSFSILRRVFLMLLVAALLAPVLEAFDDWDSSPGLACDTEFHVAALAVAAGLLAAVAIAAVHRGISLARIHRLRPAIVLLPVRAVAPLRFFSGCSPPLVPLRI